VTKGPGGPVARILELGGIVDDIQMHVHGAVIWRPGEEVLLFLDRMEGSDYRVTGFSQGKFGIERDPATGEAFVRRPAAEGTEIVGAPPGRAEEPFAGSTRVPLTQFVNHALGWK